MDDLRKEVQSIIRGRRCLFRLGLSSGAVGTVLSLYNMVESGETIATLLGPLIILSGAVILRGFINARAESFQRVGKEVVGLIVLLMRMIMAALSTWKVCSGDWIMLLVVELHLLSMCAILMSYPFDSDACPFLPTVMVVLPSHLPNDTEEEENTRFGMLVVWLVVGVLLNAFNSWFQRKVKRFEDAREALTEMAQVAREQAQGSYTGFIQAKDGPTPGVGGGMQT